MTANTFREILRRAPFEPFRVEMSSGESYNVVHPEMALISAKALIDTRHSQPIARRGRAIGVLLVSARCAR